MNGGILSSSDSGLREPFLVARGIRYIPYPIDVWVALLRSKAITPGQIKTAKLLGRQIVVYRGQDGTLGVLEDRCPHRGVNLSLGKVNQNQVQCSYHGWRLDRDGRVCDAPGMGALELRARAYAVCEAYGLVWVFVGERAAAETTPLPRVAPYATSESIDILLSADVRTHWSFALDNGLDLFHDHLHAGMPLFFKVHALEHCGHDGGIFSAGYSATLRTILNRPRAGRIDLRLDQNIVCLDFSGLPVIHALSTPISADGTEIRIWWLVSFPSKLGLRISRKLWSPFVARAMARAFRQDTAVLESEQAAFDRGPGNQYEVNPVIGALHDYMEMMMFRYTERALARGLGVTEISRETFIELAARREVAALRRVNGKLCLLDPQQSIDLPPTRPIGRILQYQHVCVVDAA
jgi:phenylpropionate dioxygenase-like ring-hydroxylating dioxygenase large terminal subunit